MVVENEYYAGEDACTLITAQPEKTETGTSFFVAIVSVPVLCLYQDYVIFVETTAFALFHYATVGIGPLWWRRKAGAGTSSLCFACVGPRFFCKNRWLSPFYGRNTRKVAPLPGVLSTVMSPPCSRAIFRLQASPSPVPLEPLVL